MAPTVPPDPTGSAHEVVCLGRSGVDIYPLQGGVGLDLVRTFGKFLGGSPTNVAVAAARLGRRTALVTRVGEDPFGDFVRAQLIGFGVDDSYVRTAPGAQTPVTFCELFPPDQFPLYFYRPGDPPDLTITADEIPADLARGAGVLWATLSGLSAEPSRTAHLAAWAARGRRRHTVLDLDYRADFWPGHAPETRAGEQARAGLEHASIAVGNLAECRVAVGEDDPARAARALLDHGVEVAVVKCGPAGVLAATCEEVVSVPALDVRVVNGLGAGDGFGGALCHGLLSGWSLPDMLRFAGAAGALVATRLECAAAMPTAAQVEALLAAAASHP
ncbi:MAG TPA: 5-dehydro-2-deoxygluconokinase [Dermatophilaceae bacterium]|nr:5-dehydro-2-deoxygluconokinase [Dermatophilaceae bacterium]